MQLVVSRDSSIQSKTVKNSQVTTIMSSNNYKRYSYVEEEIDIKPSAELIPDEYEHFSKSNQKIILYTFKHDNKEDEESEAKFLKTAESLGYTITNKYDLDKDNLKEVLEKIAKSCNNDVAGVILFFTGNVSKNNYLESKKKENCIPIQNIWLDFKVHVQLKSRPKIFIFDLTTIQPSVQTDSSRRLVNQGYDTPAEADILVICKIAEGKTDFVYQFCENIDEYGETENIITLASCVDEISSPIILSTFTRNFYFRPSDLFRGNYRVIEKHHEDIKTEVDNLKGAVFKQVVEKKKKSSILSSFRFRKSKDEDQSTEPTAPFKTAAQPRRSSGTQRTRLVSQTESEGAKKKPAWKP